MGKFASLALHLKEIDNEAEVAENEKSFTCSCSGILTINFTVWAVAHIKKSSIVNACRSDWDFYMTSVFNITKIAWHDQSPIIPTTLFELGKYKYATCSK